MNTANASMWMALTAILFSFYLAVTQSGPQPIYTDFGQVVVLSEQAQIHAGGSYHIDHSTDTGSPLDDGETLELWVSVPSTIVAHLTWQATAEGLAQTFVFENPTVDMAGTPLTPWNRNRNSTLTSGLTVAYDPTFSDDGTVLYDGEWLGSTGSPAAGKTPEENRSINEIILKSGSTYLFRVTSRADTQYAGIALNWYEISQ